jgi:hypothetical protein
VLGGRDYNRKNDSDNFNDDDDDDDNNNTNNNNKNNNNNKVLVYEGTLSFSFNMQKFNLTYLLLKKILKINLPPIQLQFITLFYMLSCLLNEVGEIR